MEFSACAAFLALIASFLSPLAAAATSGRIERGVISDMAVVGDDQNAGFSGESMGMGLIFHQTISSVSRRLEAPFAF